MSCLDRARPPLRVQQDERSEGKTVGVDSRFRCDISVGVPGVHVTALVPPGCQTCCAAKDEVRISSVDKIRGVLTGELSDPLCLRHPFDRLTTELECRR